MQRISHASLMQDNFEFKRVYRLFSQIIAEILLCYQWISLILLASLPTQNIIKEYNNE